MLRRKSIIKFHNICTDPQRSAQHHSEHWLGVKREEMMGHHRAGGVFVFSIKRNNMLSCVTLYLCKCWLTVTAATLLLR